MTSPAEAVVHPARPASFGLADLVELTRLRLTMMILITVAVGFVLGSPGPIDERRLAGVLLGLGLVSAGSTALNQVWERQSDARMARTRHRPLPAGRITVGAATGLGIVLWTAGVVGLWVVADALTAALAAVSGAVYVLVYTPLKRRSSYNTLVGAISGALPPVVGWAGAAGRIELGALVLFGVLFVWQLIHLFAIVWTYREDYAGAGLVMVSGVDDHDAALTMRLIVLSCLSMIPVSLIPAIAGFAGYPYACAALILGLGFLAAGVRLCIRHTRRDARRLFIISIVYLPLLLAALVLSRIG